MSVEKFISARDRRKAEARTHLRALSRGIFIAKETGNWPRYRDLKRAFREIWPHRHNHYGDLK